MSACGKRRIDLEQRYRAEARRLRRQVASLQNDVAELADGPMPAKRCHCGHWQFSGYQCVTCRGTDCPHEACR